MLVSFENLAASSSLVAALAAMRIIGVSMRPLYRKSAVNILALVANYVDTYGQIAFTRMALTPTSFAADRVSPSTPCFDAA